MPFFFKWAVDGLTADPTGTTPVCGALIALTPPAMLVMYGVSRAGASLCNELRNAVFAKACPMLMLPVQQLLPHKDPRSYVAQSAT